MKDSSSWYSERVQRWVRVVRWGHWGTPVLVFPTAGGDPEEIERMGLIDALKPLLEAGRIKIYSLDSIAGRAWLMRLDPRHCTWLQNQYDALVYHEVIPAIRADCRSSDIEIISAGASIGAFNALATLCRHPDAVRVAIGMSGTYDLSPWLRGHFDDDIYFASPWHYLANLGEGLQLDRLRRRFVLLAYGGGRWEAPDENWHMADVLGAKGIPHRVEAWGPEWDHDWPTWHRMLPHYLEGLA
jgi:esterase/lipase superfamily enzyme